MQSSEPPDPPKMHPKRIENPTKKCPRHNKKEWRPVVEKVWEAGWWIERGGNNYLQCYPPDDSRMIPLPSTPSSPYTLRNRIAQLRRAGVDL